MKDRTDDDELDRLLARGKLSGATRERVLDSVLASHAKQATGAMAATGKRLYRGGAFGAVLALAAAVLLWARWGARVDPSDPSFTAKGGALGVSVDVTCLEGRPCRLGQTLVFQIDHVPSSGYLCAYAVAGNGERIWYFPAADGAEPEVKAQAEPQVVPRGAVLGPPHHPGRYVVHTILVRRPIPREAVLGVAEQDVIARSSREIEIGP